MQTQKLVVIGFFSLLNVLPAQAFPLPHEFINPLIHSLLEEENGEAPTTTGGGAQYNFEGIVALNNCSGSLIRFEKSQDSDKAIILSNGHCVELSPPGKVIVNKPTSRTFSVLSPDAQRSLGTVQSTMLLYSTMTKTDVSLYQLAESYQEIAQRLNTRALLLSAELSKVGDSIEVISGYWKHGYSCKVERFAYALKEADWTFFDSLAYSRPGCEVRGGTSGSPVILAGTRTVVAVNNTINENGERCTLNNPCEVDQQGTVTHVEMGRGYAQPTVWIYSCLDTNNQLDLNREGCLLAK